MKCPVCAYADLPYQPTDYNICPCCGTEFGNDDSILSHDELRAQWLANGAGWFFGNPPIGWNPYMQLLKGQLRFEVPPVSVTVAPTENMVLGLLRPDYELVAA